MLVPVFPSLSVTREQLKPYQTHQRRLYLSIADLYAVQFWRCATGCLRSVDKQYQSARRNH
jgi:hypothetical protein